VTVFSALNATARGSGGASAASEDVTGGDIQGGPKTVPLF